MTYKETLEERETIINTTEADSTYDIFTQNPKLRREFAAYAKQYPDLCKHIKHDEEYGSDWFVVSKKSLKIKFLKPISEERRQFLAEHARNTFHKAGSESKHSKS